MTIPKIMFLAPALAALLGSCCNCEHGVGQPKGLFGCECVCDPGWSGKECDECTGFECINRISMDIDTGSADIPWSTDKLELTWQGNTLEIEGWIEKGADDDWIDILICNPGLGTHDITPSGCHDVSQKLSTDTFPYSDRFGATNYITITRYNPPDTVEAEFEFSLENAGTSELRELKHGTVKYRK